MAALRGIPSEETDPTIFFFTASSRLRGVHTAANGPNKHRSQRSIDARNTYPSPVITTPIPGQPPTPHRVSLRRHATPLLPPTPTFRNRASNKGNQPSQPACRAERNFCHHPTCAGSEGLHNSERACHGGSAGSRPRRGLASKFNIPRIVPLHDEAGDRRIYVCHAIPRSPGRLAGGRYLTGLSCFHIWRLLS